MSNLHPGDKVSPAEAGRLLDEQAARILAGVRTSPRYLARATGPCPCACNSGGFCGGCGHAGCGGRR